MSSEGTTAGFEVISDGDCLIAMIVRAGYCRPGLRFFSPPEFSQQLGHMRHPAGTTVLPHVHNLVTREVSYTQEVLFVRSGAVRVDLYSEQRQPMVSRVLEAGDVILLAAGGHGLEVLEACDIVEVKQGPYAGQQDKEHFEVADIDDPR
jgi:hypothetical protein